MTQTKDPDYHVWPPRTLRQSLINLRGLLFGPRMVHHPKGDAFPGGFGALFSQKLEIAPEAVGWWKQRKLTTLPEYQPDRYAELVDTSPHPES